jgi:hypothetical protein
MQRKDVKPSNLPEAMSLRNKIACKSGFKASKSLLHQSPQKCRKEFSACIPAFLAFFLAGLIG